MRKVTVVLDPAFVRRVLPRKYHIFLDMVEYVEGVHILRIDPARGMKLVIVDMKLRPGRRLEELDAIPNVKVLDIIEQTDGVYTVLVKAEGDRRLRSLSRLFPVDVSYELPFRYDSGKMLDVRVQRAIVSDTDPVALLTDKQRAAVLAARRLGYYDIPRRAGTSRVARELRLSKSTTLEHLRKAERRLMGHLLAGR
jgi:hypothetical protein